MSRSWVAALVAAVLIALPCAARAQGDVRIDLPPQDPFPAAPEIMVHLSNFPASTAPRTVRLRLALDGGFGLVVYDTAVAGDQARFTTTRLLPENRDIYVQATVFDGQGRTLTTVAQFAGRTGPRLRLLAPFPDKKCCVSLDSRQPRFSWRSATVTGPPGPWLYDLYITSVATQSIIAYTNIQDSSFVLPDSLESNASYRWRVVARLAQGVPSDSVAVSAASSFTITPSDAPLATLLYQNFPNPFPAASSQTTCVWFDLKVSTKVSLTILDLRGNLVKTMIPGAFFGANLPSGRYGRLREIDGAGCDPRLAWDGTADNGRGVPPGIYLLRFKTDNAAESIKKIVYLGR